MVDTVYGRKEDVKEVCVQDIIKGVTLRLITNTSSQVLTTKQDILFSGQLSPSKDCCGKVFYHYFRSDKFFPWSDGPDFRFIPDGKPGRFDFYVKASNGISQVTSNKITVDVMEPISSLSIHHQSHGGKQIQFVAHLVTGTNVTFNWKFGDGSQDIKTTSSAVYHTFTKNGEFDVTLIASNDIAEETASITVYVSDVPEFYAPEVFIAGDMTEVYRSQEMRLEPNVIMNLSSSMVVKELHYLWKVKKVDDGDGGDNVDDDDDDDDDDDIDFTKRVLIFPPRTLVYGNYEIQLEVIIIAGKGRHVSSKNTRQVKVTRSPLVAVISGGSERTIGKKNGRITLNASSSHDPDYPDENHKLRFKWECRSHGKSTSCFKASRLPEIDFNQNVLTFDLDWLVAGAVPRFEVAVSKQDDPLSFSAFQTIRIGGDDNTMHVFSDCLQCEKGLINPSQSLIITGSCLSCPLDNQQKINYEWELFEGGNTAKGKTQDCPEDNQNGPSGGGGGTTPSQAPAVTPINSFYSEVIFSNGSVCLDPKQILASSESSQENSTEPWERRRSGQGNATGNGTGHGSGYGTGHSTGHGTGYVEGAGHVAGDMTGHSSLTYKDHEDDNKTHLPQAMNMPKHQSSDPKELRYLILRVLKNQTTTGLGRPNFVLLGDFLKDGQNYMVRFKVEDKKTGKKGTSSIKFKASDSLKCGDCQIMPSVGVTLKTTFQLLCSNWKSRRPVQYHVHYIIKGYSVREPFFIYSGFKEVITFVLPSGMTLFNRTIQVHVTVADGLSANRNFKPLQVQVKPQTAPAGVSMEDILLNETDGRNLSLLQVARDEQGVLQFITALSVSLNRLASVKNDSSKFYLRGKIREKLLHIIQNLTVYDKFSALQTCLTLQYLTSKPEELSASSVGIVSQVLNKIIEVISSQHNKMQKSFIEARQLLSQDLIQSATTVTSNLIEAVSLVKQRYDNNISMHQRDALQQDTMENMLAMAAEATEQLIKTKLSTQVFGEQSLQISTRNIKVVTTQRRSVSDSLFSLSDFKFQMPSNLETQLNVSEKCYGTMMIIFQQNPFFKEVDHTRVASLIISGCSGKEIQVKNLSSDIFITIPQDHGGAERHPQNFTLPWKHENIHVINKTDILGKQSLQIYLKPLSALPSGFIIKLLVSNGKENNVYRSTGEVVNVFLYEQQLINGSLNASVTLEDTSYYRLKSVKAVERLDYLLGVQWMGCFYWDKNYRHWARDGCKLERKTKKALHCRCNHLTAFSGGFGQPAVSLHIKDLRDFEKLKNSPLAMALVICILALYFLLLAVCVHADKYDKKKLGVIHLDDNASSPATSQTFQISVQTGHWFGSGTSAGVYLILHGDDVVSYPIELKCAGKPLFQRSSCDVFVWSVPKSLIKNISKIHVWHDNKGEYPSWFLERITIKDVQTCVRWVFECNRWLAVDEDDGKVECELFAKTNWSTGLKQSFTQHTTKSFVDYHLWLSLFGCPSYSRFTRAQRLSCCLSLLLSFLCVSIAWYRPKTEIAEVLGILDITAESIVIGVLCSVLVLPVNLLWIFLFRYSRRTFRHRVKVYPVSDHQTENTELVSSSVLDQSLATMLILNNIGDRRQCIETGQDLGKSPEAILDGTSPDDNLNLDLPLPKGSADLVETCDFLAALAPTEKKHGLEVDKQSAYSVCVSTVGSEGRGPYRSGFSVPHIFVYVAWFGCLMTAAVASMVTVWCGVSFGWDLSVRWLQSLAFSLLESLFLSQQIMVWAFIFYMARKSQTSEEDQETDEGFEDLSTSALHEIHYGHLNHGFEDQSNKEEELEVALRRKLRHLKYLNPPPKSRLLEAREKCLKSNAMWNYAVEVFVFIMFFVVTCVLVVSVTRPDVYHLNQSIKKTFLRSNVPSRHENLKEAWQKISTVLIENTSTPSPFTMLLPGTQSLLFGKTRIKKYFSPNVTVCREISSTTHSNASSTLCHSECHASGGSWMAMELNQTRAEASKQLKLLAESHWINSCTREISTEFAIYTPFLRAISAITLSVKASFIGIPKYVLELSTAPVFFSSANYGYFVRIIKLLFVLFYLYIFQHEFFLALKMSSKYFENFWRGYQLLTIIFSSACLVFYVHWSLCLYALLREVETASQTRVFFHAKQVSWSQRSLQVSYSLLLFLLVIRCLYLLRLFRSVSRLGRILASSAAPLLGCGVLCIIFLMAFAHSGHLLFGGLHSPFKSFGDVFLLVTSFFRLEGVSRYQDPALEERTVLLSIYFGLFMIGCWTIIRGSTAAVLVHKMPHLRKRRINFLSSIFGGFIRKKLQLLKDKMQRHQRRDSISSYGETDENEDEDDYEEDDNIEEEPPFPMEHVLDELDNQIVELSWRVENLFGDDLSLGGTTPYSDDVLSCWSTDNNQDDVEYLYRATDDPSINSAGSGYESDHSSISAPKSRFPSCSSLDLSRESSRLDQLTGARSNGFPVGEVQIHGHGGDHSLLTVHANKTRRKRSCSNTSLSDESGSLIICAENGCPIVSSSQGDLSDVPSAYKNPNILRSIVLRDSDLHDGVLRDKKMRDRTVSLDDAASKDLLSSSRHSLSRLARRPDKEPIKPKCMYGLVRGHSLLGETAFPELTSLPPCPNTTTGECSLGESTCSSSDFEVRRKGRKSRSRKCKGVFRSAAVFPTQDGSGLSRSLPQPRCPVWLVDSGSVDSGVQSVPEPDSSNRPLEGRLGDICMNEQPTLNRNNKRP